MTTEMSLRLDESELPDLGHDSFDPSPVPIWAEFNDGSWRIGLRFQSRNGQPVLTEVRIFPAESDSRPGRWSGDVAIIDAGGLRPALVKSLAVGALRNQAIQRLTDPGDSFWVNDWPVPAENWFDVAFYAGIEAHAAADVPERPGRKPLSDKQLALVARYYTQAMQSGAKSSHKYVREQMEQRHGEYLSATTISGRIHKARERGFLTPVEKKGMKGGSLTKRARDVLQKIDDEQGDL
jgi:hypothetical protein